MIGIIAACVVLVVLAIVIVVCIIRKRKSNRSLTQVVTLESSKTAIASEASEIS